MKIAWRWKASSQFSCKRLCRQASPAISSVRESEMAVPVQESSVPQSVGGEGRSLSMADIQGRSEEHQSLPSARTGQGALQCLLAQTRRGTAILCAGLALCQPGAGGGRPACLVPLTWGLWPRDWFGMSRKSQLGEICALGI